MALIFVAHSKTIALWGGDVGLGKNLFLVGLADTAEEVSAFLAGKPCGAEDWVMVKQQECGHEDQPAILDKLAIKEKRVDPALYPRLRGLTGLFKVKLESVENHMMVKKALEGLHDTTVKLKNPDIALYLIHNATK